MALAFLHPDPSDTPHVRRVAATAPFLWLAKGWDDMWRTTSISLVYGVLATLAGGILLWLSRDYTHLAPALASGFLLVAPVLAINLYALSRRLERGEPIDWLHLFDDWRQNRGSIALYGLGLAFVLMTWERISAILFALFYRGDVPGLAHFAAEVWLSGAYLELVTAYLFVGGVLAVVVFCFSVVSLPMMLDRDVDALTAVSTSLDAIRTNPSTMLLWAALIAVLTGIGFAALMIPLVIIFPLLAHASWHCYRDVVGRAH